MSCLGPRSQRAGRTFTFAFAVAASLGGCVAYPYASQEGSYGVLPAGEPRAGTARPSHAELISLSTGTYVDRLLADRDSVIERWPDRVNNPIRVWIEAGNLEPWEAGFPQSVAGAFNEWVDTGIPLRFQFVSDANRAEVRVHWAERLRDKTGSTTWRTTGAGWIQGSDVTLATHMSSGQPLDRANVRQIALHEIGHVIGLSHSNDSHDIMSPVVRVDALSRADVATARLIYAMPAGRVH
jgi:matrixin